MPSPRPRGAGHVPPPIRPHSDLHSAADPRSPCSNLHLRWGDFPVGSGPFSIAVGDFNGDGITDLAVGNSVNSTVSILLGRPDSTFAPPSYLRDRSGSARNRDRRRQSGPGRHRRRLCSDQIRGLDCSLKTVSILLGNGDGTFGPHIDYYRHATFFARHR